MAAVFLDDVHEVVLEIGEYLTPPRMPMQPSVMVPCATWMRNAEGHDAQATLLCSEAAIVQALFLERRQRCRVQTIEGPDSELIDREMFEREHLKRLRW
jgi:hypothetical protein